MGVQDHNDSDTEMLVQKGAPAMGIPVDVAATPAAVEAQQVEVVEVLEPTIAHYWPACIGTFFCHLFGFACTLLLCPSKYGKAGAASGFAMSSLKWMIVASMSTYVLVHHYHTPHSYSMEAMVTEEDCVMAQGNWMNVHDKHVQHDRFLHPHLNELKTDAAGGFCACPRLYFQSMDDAGVLHCLKTTQYWFNAACLSFVFFVLFMAIRARYLQDAPVVREVVVTRDEAGNVQPAYTTEGVAVVVREV